MTTPSGAFPGPAPQPLVAVTRAAGTNGELIALLRAEGMAVVELPLIRFMPPQDETAWLAWVRERVAAAPGGREWLAVTSPQGARALRAALEALGVDRRAAEALRLAVVGAGTAAVLEAGGWRAAFQPSLAEARVLGAELPALAGECVWHLTSQQSEPTLGEVLSRRGVSYRRVEAYRTEDAVLAPSQRKALREAAVVVLASGSAVRALAAQLGAASVAGTVVVMGAPSERAARAAGFGRVVVAERPGLHELGRAAVRAASREGWEARPDQLSDRSVRDG